MKKASIGDNTNGRRPLVEILEQMESLDAELTQTKAKMQEVLSGAEANGRDKKAIKQLLKERKADTEKTAALRVLVDRYRKELGTFGDTELGEWAAAQEAALNTARRSTTPKLLKTQPEPETLN